jgi:hypothetical protein
MSTFDPHCATAEQIGEILSISGRHVRRYAEQGLLPIIKPGRFDLTWMVHLRVGEELARKMGRQNLDRNTLVALARDKDQSAGDVALFVEMFERNGETRDAALIAMGRAQGIRK